MATAERKKLIKELNLLLGGSMIDIELEHDDFDLCIDLAMDRYRQRSGNSMEKSVIFLDTQPDVSVYTLPNEVQEVQEIFRRVNSISGGSTVDPFALAFAQNIYSMQNPTMMGGSGAGSLALFDFAAQYQSLAGRMFGRDIQFTWDAPTKRLTLHRKLNAVETIGLGCMNIRPEEIIMKDILAKPWIRSYALAQCKMMIGQARSKFASIAGPQGGITLNGDQLKSEAQAELDKLEEEIRNLVDQRQGYGFVIG